VLLFSSNRRGAAGGLDLFTARRSVRGGFEPAAALPGDINTRADEFDATFLSDSRTIVFSRARDIKVDQVNLFYAALRGGHYDAGTLLPLSVNVNDKDTYGPMLDWSRTDHITFSSQRHEANAGSVDLYVIRYRY
jgi:hypothetical protein